MILIFQLGTFCLNKFYLALERDIERNDFVGCGIIYIEKGHPWIAYQLLV